jgi:hypothetical protein
MNKNKEKTSRRKFLGVAGTSLAGLAIVSSMGVTQTKAQTFSSETHLTLENWLLDTGKDDISTNLYETTAEQI